MPLQLEEKSNAFYKRIRILCMAKELYLNNKYVEDLCCEDSILETIPHLLSRLPMLHIDSTRESDKLVENLRRDSDSIHAFISSCCVLNKGKWAAKRILYEVYASYCIRSDKEAHKKHTFMRHIRSQGIKEGRHPVTNEACWRGIGINKGGQIDEKDD